MVARIPLFLSTVTMGLYIAYINSNAICPALAALWQTHIVIWTSHIRSIFLVSPSYDVGFVFFLVIVQKSTPIPWRPSFSFWSRSQDAFVPLAPVVKKPNDFFTQRIWTITYEKLLHHLSWKYNQRPPTTLAYRNGEDPGVCCSGFPSHCEGKQNWKPESREVGYMRKEFVIVRE